MNVIDRAIGYFSPSWGVKRAHSRRLLRTYQGAESNRLTNTKKPKNQSADSELLGPHGADAARAWARSFVRDNAYGNGIVETIATAVVGCGIHAQSMVEDAQGNDAEEINDIRDAAWQEWCEVCDINGQMHFAEIQFLAMREMVEAGECLLHFVPVKAIQDGIKRNIPLALELIEADRFSLENDTYVNRQTENRVIRGVELDSLGRPVAYWIYPQHPNAPYIARNYTPKRIPASEIIHLFRRDRIGQTRGVTWFAPVLSPIRDLGVYIDNELQASAVAACFTAAIKTDMPITGLNAGDDEDTTDDNSNTFEYLEPGMVTRLRPGESIEAVNPGRPNSQAEPWINLITRNIGVGVGLGYEKVSRDFSRTSYSSARTSELEDRRRFKRWQQYLIRHLCQPVYDRFCEAAATAGVPGYPTLTDLLANRRGVCPVTWQVPEWEWVDPQNDQAASEAAIKANMSTLQRECAKNGINWRENLRQRAKERSAEVLYGVVPVDSEIAAVPAGNTTQDATLQSQALNGAQVTSLMELITAVGTGALPAATAKAIIDSAFPLISQEQINAIIDPIQPGSIVADGTPQPVSDTSEAGSGEMMGLSTLQWNRNRKAIAKILDELTSGATSEAAARVFLASLGMKEASIEALIADATDGTPANIPSEVATA